MSHVVHTRNAGGHTFIADLVVAIGTRHIKPGSASRTDGVAAVGLPQGQMGTSEVGHMNMSGGRIIDMDIARIDLLIAPLGTEPSIIVPRAKTPQGILQVPIHPARTRLHRERHGQMRA